MSLIDRYSVKNMLLFVKLRKLSSLGDLEAKNHLAWLYYKGKGVKPDFDRAYELWNEAANSMFSPAIINLSFMNHSCAKKYNKSWLETRIIPDDDLGNVVDKPYYISLIELAANQEIRKSGNNDMVCNSIFLHTLNLFYGIGGEPSKLEANKWLKYASIDNEPLAKMFTNKQSVLDVKKYIEIASTSNDEYCIFYHAYLLLVGLLYERDVNRSVNTIVRLGREGFVPAYEVLIRLYHPDGGMFPNRSECAFWWGMRLHPDKPYADERPEPGKNWVPPRM